MRRVLITIAFFVVLIATPMSLHAQDERENPRTVADSLREAADTMTLQTWYDSYLDAAIVAQRTKKQMLLVFQTEWCRWCQAMNDSTWSKPEITRRSGSLIFARVDGDIDTATTAKFHVYRFPTTILTTDKGVEVDRFVGYFGPAELGTELTRALEGEGTMWELERKQSESRGDPKITFAMAREFIERGEFQRAQEFLTRAQAADADGSFGIADDALFVEARLEREAKNWYKALEDLKKLIKDHPDTEWREDAELYIPWLYAQTGDKKEALKKYNDFLENYGSSTETQWVKRQIAKLETPKEVPTDTPSQPEGK